MFEIEGKSIEQLSDFFKENSIIEGDENIIAIEKPGEGNMNFVLRILTNRRSVICKQSRPYVQKYPSIEAPIERILVEAQFYKTIQQSEFLSSRMPKLLAELPDDFLIILEDLGANSDYSYLYKKEAQFDEKELINLTDFLSKLHEIKVEKYAQNLELKSLNYFHIFKFPFELENGFDLDQIQLGLADISMPLKTNDFLKSKIADLGEIYLAEGDTLIHGDFYPGSWLKTGNKTMVIDPEFSYLGRPEFDLAIFIAHLAIAQKGHLINIITANYKRNDTFDNQLMCGFVGVEILRRLIGVAQLPAMLSLQEKKQLINDAQGLILNQTTL
jgi:5-methylthioribose kinase